MIPFNKPYLTGNEINYIIDAVDRGKLSGNGYYTGKCQTYLHQRYGFNKCLLTTSCTDALEMAAILCNITPGDEVIVPSYTFVSTANAFVLRGAKIVFADSRSDHPGIDEMKIESLITPKTKVIVPVHYAGVSCEMETIMRIADKYNLIVVEDAAQAIDTFYLGRVVGSIGHMACFSFHETKNIQCGEGGMLVINDDRFLKRAEIIWEKGTNRAEFFRGEVNKYGWVDIGSSFLPSEIIAAFLYAQLEDLSMIQNKRKKIWEIYYEGLQSLSNSETIKLPVVPSFSSKNYHAFYILCKSLDLRSQLISYLKDRGILSVFHYLPLHLSEYYLAQGYSINDLPLSINYSNTLLRLPMYFEISDNELNYIINEIRSFFEEL
jgi:dTDP-4-amino-4,6-dideoxygalactose transaminase